jgi:hypothetical protein
MNIAIIDAELIDGNHRFPNLACMKLSAYHKAKSDNVVLSTNYEDIPKYDKVYVSCVFSSIGLNVYDDYFSYLNMPHVEYGGTGFYYQKYESSPFLPYEIEHSRPDYNLYDGWVLSQMLEGRKKGKSEASIRASLKYYTDYSIGFTTRGCFRHCEFCVNRHSKASIVHSPVDEFFDKDRKKICCLDDNILACASRMDILLDLINRSEKEKMCFEYKQGMDIRLMTDEIASLLSSARYCGDFIFAFDNIKDREIIEKKTELFRKYIPDKTAKFYTFCGFKSQGAEDIETVLERISILWKYNCLAYVMRHENHLNAPHPYRGMYTQLARWCNQPAYQKKLTFRVFCKRSKGLSAKVMEDFEALHPDIAKKYFDHAFPFGSSKYLDLDYYDEWTRQPSGWIYDRDKKIAIS